jgi:DNA-binding transcriptional MerR regulator
VDLQTIGQIAKEHGVSTRMLRYYEEIGLIESQRKGDGAYRVYDEANIRRLRQIIILRKLRVSVKQIVEILSNPNAAAAVEIFNKNIDELDDEIATLSAVKSLLVRFVEKLSETAQIKLTLDFMSDDSVLVAVETLSFAKNHKKEILPMDDLKDDLTMDSLNKLDKYPKQTPARIVYLPPATIASVVSTKRKHESDAYKQLVKFAEDNNLMKIKPDARTFGYNLMVGDTHGYKAWITIPNDMAVDTPFEKSTFPGGLYACHTRGFMDLNFDEAKFIHEWINNHDVYEFDNRTPIGMYKTIEEQFKLTPYAVNGKTGDYLHIDFLVPIKIVKEKTV